MEFLSWSAGFRDLTIFEFRRVGGLSGQIPGQMDCRRRPESAYGVAQHDHDLAARADRRAQIRNDFPKGSR